MAEVPAGDKVQLTLPDKSSVKLNSESSLSYAYVNGKRVARLKGEGYFQVSKDRKHPFVVQVGNLNIEVLGTCFNVYSYEENDFVETSLIEGSVRLYDSKSPSESFILKPSQKAIYSKNNGKISFHNTDNVKETAWTQNHLVFESEKLGSVFQKIERWYGVHIDLLCPEIANDQISGSFKDEQLPYVMEALKFQYGFNYEITGNNVTINKSNQLKIK
nr:FecR domain-containing protein [Parabacteroides merdae]